MQPSWLPTPLPDAAADAAASAAVPAPLCPAGAAAGTALRSSTDGIKAQIHFRRSRSSCELVFATDSCIELAGSGCMLAGLLSLANKDNSATAFYWI